ncbi:MAG: hypothetical protein RIF33_06120 [Cyclobacteriaceae bacterium]
MLQSLDSLNIAQLETKVDSLSRLIQKQQAEIEKFGITEGFFSDILTSQLAIIGWIILFAIPILGLISYASLIRPFNKRLQQIEIRNSDQEKVTQGYFKSHEIAIHIATYHIYDAIAMVYMQRSDARSTYWTIMSLKHLLEYIRLYSEKDSIDGNFSKSLYWITIAKGYKTKIDKGFYDDAQENLIDLLK